MAGMKDELKRIAGEVGVPIGPDRRSLWTRGAVGAAATVLLVGVVYWFAPNVIPPSGEQGPAPDGGGVVGVAEVIPAADVRRLAGAFDRACAGVRESGRDVQVIHAGMVNDQSLWDWFFRPISLTDVESGLQEFRGLCDETDRLVEMDDFVAEVQSELDRMEQRLAAVRPECSPPVSMNWIAEVQNVERELQALVRAMDRMNADDGAEVERLQNEVRVRIGVMRTSVAYYEQFADDICAAHDRMKPDIEAEERRGRLLADVPVELFRNGWEGLSQSLLNQAVRSFRSASLVFPGCRDCEALFESRRFADFQRGWRIFRNWPTQRGLAAILIPPRLAGQTQLAPAGFGGDVEVVKHYLTVEDGQVVVGSVGPSNDRRLMFFHRRSQNEGQAVLRQESTGLRVGGNEVFIRHGWGPTAEMRGSDRPLVDYLERIQPYVQTGVNRECHNDFLREDGHVTLRTRFGAGLARLEPSLSRSEREALFSIFEEAMRELESATGVIDQICSANSPTLGADYLRVLFEEAQNKWLAGARADSDGSVALDDPTALGRPTVTLASGAAPSYLAEFDRAFWVGERLMQALQIDQILQLVNVNGDAVEGLRRVVDASDGVRFESEHLESSLRVMELVDAGPVGRARERYEKEYRETLAARQAVADKAAFLLIENKHDMAELLEQNRSALEQKREDTRKAIAVAKVEAEATIEKARIEAEAKIREAQLRQAEKPGFFGSLLSTVGGLVGTAVGGPIVGAVSSKLTSLIAPAPAPRVTATETRTEESKEGDTTVKTVTETVTAPPAPPGGAGR